MPACRPTMPVPSRRSWRSSRGSGPRWPDWANPIGLEHSGSCLLTKRTNWHASRLSMPRKSDQCAKPRCSRWFHNNGRPAAICVVAIDISEWSSPCSSKRVVVDGRVWVRVFHNRDMQGPGLKSGSPARDTDFYSIYAAACRTATRTALKIPLPLDTDVCQPTDCSIEAVSTGFD